MSAPGHEGRISWRVTGGRHGAGAAREVPAARPSWVAPAAHAEAAGPRQAADAEGLRQAFLAHGGELFGFARRSLNDHGLAEEAVQETFVRAWRSRARFDDELGTLRGWLFAIERRVVIDLARRRSSYEQTPLEHELGFIEDSAERAMLGWEVEEAVRRLRPEHQRVLREVYFHNRSGRDVAAMLGVPEGTVRSRLFYALRSLRLILEEMGWNE